MGKRQSTSAVASNVRSTRRASRREQQRSYDDVVVPIIPNIRKSFSLKDLKRVVPLTDNQEIAFEEWEKGQHLVLGGYAGVGKSFLGLYLALKTVLDPDTPQKKVVIIRSTVPTRDQGFLPGELSEKEAPYEAPYDDVCNQLFTWRNSYANLKELGIIEFKSTSFLRGNTLDDSIVLVDELQNMDGQEADTVITRMGKNSRIILCGDDLQTDLKKDSAFDNVMNILYRMDEVSMIEFELQDIVRSGFVRAYLMAKYRDRI